MKAFIFDLDGTLLDSLEDLADAGNAMLTHADYPQHPVAAYRHFVGDGLEMLVRRALPAGEEARLGAENFAALVQYTRDVYGKNWQVKSRPYPGVVEALRALADKGHELGVLSNKPHHWTVDIIGHFFPTLRFSVVRGALPGVPHKPDPAPAQEVLRMLDMPASVCAFVGDSNVDMLTAVRTGMVPVGVSWGFRDVEELRNAGARYIVYAPAELTMLA